jgi:methyl-CpG-binding domain protein 4
MVNSKAMTKGEYAELSEYEKERLRNIEANQAVLRKIGLKKMEKKPAPRKVTPRSNRKRSRQAVGKKRQLEKSSPVRRSTRIRGKPAPKYGEEKVEVGASSNAGNGVEARRQAKAKAKKDTTETVLRRAKEWLEASRSLLAPAVEVKAEEGSGKGTDPYRQKALDRWGEGVLLSKTDDWETYYLSRLSSPSPHSPMDLLQEHYNECPWKLLVSCCLMSRVSSAQVKEKALSLFFNGFPTPTKALAANPADVFPLIAPLGLFETRFKSIIEISTRFLTMSPMFQVGLTKELKIYGIGVFGLDSFNIFCRDFGGEMTPSDRNLQNYCRWRKQQPGRNKQHSNNTPEKSASTLKSAKHKTKASKVPAGVKPEEETNQGSIKFKSIKSEV